MAKAKQLQKEVQATERRTIVAKMYERGWSQAAIAKHVGASPPTISRDLQRIQKDWAEQYTGTYHAHLNRELAKLDQIEREAWDAWERSKEDAESIEESERGVKRTRRGQVGDAGFLHIVERTIAQRCKLLGVGEPERVKHEVSGGVGLVQVVVQDRGELDEAIEYAEFKRLTHEGNGNGKAE